MNNFSGNSYYIIPEGEKVELEFLNTYLYILQKENTSTLKLWYKDVWKNKTHMLSIKSNVGNISSCIEAIDMLICKEGMIGLDFSDAFHYMGGESGFSRFNEYSIRYENDRLMVNDLENAKLFCKMAKEAVVLIDGWYTLYEAQEILELLECDDVEVAFQVHLDESKTEGKIYLWISD